MKKTKGKDKSVRPCVLTIAGSDSGGNAGVQADLRMFHAYGLHGCTVFAALTAQNPRGVFGVHPVPPSFVAAQLDAVLSDYSIAALKTGMLQSSSVIKVVAEKLASRPDILKVVDPVMVATSGARLIAPSAVKALERELLPLATIITPNVPETEVLLGHEVKNASDAAMELFDRFGAAVLVKGGHSKGGKSVDWLYDGATLLSYSLPRISNPVSTHGTGCSLGAAIAAGLARGESLADAVAIAKKAVWDAISNSYNVGRKCGVLAMPERL